MTWSQAAKTPWGGARAAWGQAGSGAGGAPAYSITRGVEFFGVNISGQGGSLITSSTGLQNQSQGFFGAYWRVGASGNQSQAILAQWWNDGLGANDSYIFGQVRTAEWGFDGLRFWSNTVTPGALRVADYAFNFQAGDEVLAVGVYRGAEVLESNRFRLAVGVRRSGSVLVPFAFQTLAFSNPFGGTDPIPPTLTTSATPLLIGGGWPLPRPNAGGEDMDGILAQVVLGLTAPSDATVLAMANANGEGDDWSGITEATSLWLMGDGAGDAGVNILDQIGAADGTLENGGATGAQPTIVLWSTAPAAPGPFPITPAAGEEFAFMYASGASYVRGTSSGGLGEDDELSTVQVGSNRRGVNGTSPHGPQTPGLVPLVTVGTESLLEGHANEWSRQWSAYTAGIITHHRCDGGFALSVYAPGGAPYINATGQVDDVVTAVSPNNVIYALLYEGGGFFSDMTSGVPWATTESTLRAILSAWRSELVARTGQAIVPPFVLEQNGWSYLDPDPAAPTLYIQEMLDLCLTDPDFIMDTPTYMLAVGSDNIHLLDEAYRYFALIRGYIANRIVGLGEDWQPLHITSAVASGNTVVLTYSVPNGGTSLVLDTDGSPVWRTTPASSTNHGFRHVENLGPSRAVTGVTVDSPTQITVQLDGAAEVGGTLGYADFGAQPPNAPNGNLRTNVVRTTPEGVDLSFWAAAQRITIT